MTLAAAANEEHAYSKTRKVTYQEDKVAQQGTRVDAGGDLAINAGQDLRLIASQAMTITKALLNVIADAKTKVYGDADPSLTYQVSGLKNGDSAGSILTGGLNRAAGENVGVYGINQGDLPDWRLEVRLLSSSGTGRADNANGVIRRLSRAMVIRPTPGLAPGSAASFVVRDR